MRTLTNITKNLGKLAAVCLVFLWIAPLSAQQELDSLALQIDEARAQHTRLLESFNIELAEYDALVGIYDELRGQQSDSMLESRQELQLTWRLAQDASRPLNMHQAELRELAARIAELEEEQAVVISERIAAVEARLRATDSGDRAAVFAELDRLNRMRQSLVVEPTEVPEVDFESILLDLDEYDTPEDLIADAEELEDNERRFQEHLVELEEQIEYYEQQLAIQEQHRAFQREASLFEEDANQGRHVPSRTNTSSSGARQSDTETGGQTAASANDPTRSGSDNGAMQDQDGDSAEPTAAADDIHNAEGNDGSYSGDDTDEGLWDGAGEAEPGGVGGGGYEGEAPPGDTVGLDGQGRSETPDYDPSYDPAPSAPGLNPITTGVERPGTDPVLLLGGNSYDGDDQGQRGGRGQVEDLRRQRADTLRTIDEIQRRREAILERAAELEALELY